MRIESTKASFNFKLFVIISVVFIIGTWVSYAFVFASDEGQIPPRAVLPNLIVYSFSIFRLPLHGLWQFMHDAGFLFYVTLLLNPLLWALFIERMVFIASRFASLKIAIPLTVISFVLVTKWWYAFPDDAPDTMYRGFPLPYYGAGWHTSLSRQVFVFEMIVDLLTYFAFWFIVVICFNRYVAPLRPWKIVTVVLWTLTGLIFFSSIFISGLADDLYHFRRPYRMKVVDTGYEFLWKSTPRPDPEKYREEKP